MKKVSRALLFVSSMGLFFSKFISDDATPLSICLWYRPRPRTYLREQLPIHRQKLPDRKSEKPFSKVIDKFIVRSVRFSLFLTNNSLRRLSVVSTTAVQRDGRAVALGVHVVVVRTRTTHVNDKTTPSCLLKTR